MAQNLVKARVGTPGGRVAFDGVSAAWAPVLVVPGGCRKLIFCNSLDKEIALSLDGGATILCYFSAALIGLPFVLDFDTSMQYSGTVSIKEGTEGACTFGLFSAGAIFGG